MVGMAFMPRPDLKCVMIQNVSIPIVLPEMQIGDLVNAKSQSICYSYE